MSLPLEVIAALVYAPSVAVLLAIPRTSNRYWLAVSLSTAIPIVGPCLAIVAHRARGTGALERDLAAAPPLEVSCGDPKDLADAAARPNMMDRLMSTDANERLTALVSLPRPAGPEAIAMLRWVVGHGPPEAVLDAALTLDEIEINWEKEVDEALQAAADCLQGSGGRASGGDEERASIFEEILRPAALIIQGIESGLVDAARLPDMAGCAHEHCDRALAYEPGCEDAVAVQRCRLYLACRDPGRAFSLSDERLRAPRSAVGARDLELRELHARARFALRRSERHGPAEGGGTVYLPPPPPAASAL